MNNKRFKVSAVIFIIFMLVACGIFAQQLVQNTKLPSFGSSEDDENATEISIIYAPESKPYLDEAIRDFNDSYKKGINPVDGKKLDKDEKIIRVVGKDGSSGTVRTQIVNAINGSNTSNVEKPTIFAPSVSHWLRLVNYETNKEIFKVDEAVPTANAPVVIAIWESRLNAIKAKNPGKEIGWKELLEVINSKNGWADYSPSISRKKVYYGHTDPFVSSTALSTLISEYFASAKYLSATPDQNLDQLALANVNDAKVKEGVKGIERLIKHYSSRTTEFKEYIAQGPNYLDFVALEENDLVFINQGKTQYKPTEKLVALYPKEGTYIHEHPFAVPNADWVSEEQRTAAKKFTDYILTEKVQNKVVENGFRPANTAVSFENNQQYGIDKNQPKAVLKVPTPEVISGVQQNWNFVKKRSELYVLLDASGSMDGQKMVNAKKAINAFNERLPVDNSVGLISFSNEPKDQVPLASLESNKVRLNTAINEINANGSTALYDGLLKSITDLESKATQDKSDKIRAIVLLSDGNDTSSKASLGDVVKKLQDLQNSDNPILVIPIGYGKDADNNALNAIARASSTKVQYGDTGDIDKLLEVISSYF